MVSCLSGRAAGGRAGEGAPSAGPAALLELALALAFGLLYLAIPFGAGDGAAVLDDWTPRDGLDFLGLVGRHLPYGRGRLTQGGHAARERGVHGRGRAGPAVGQSVAGRGGPATVAADAVRAV